MLAGIRLSRTLTGPGLLLTVWLGAATALALDGVLATVTADPANVLVNGRVVATIPKDTKIWIFEAKNGVGRVLIPGTEKFGQISGRELQVITVPKEQLRQFDQANAEVKRLQARGEQERAATRQAMDRALRLYRDAYGDDHPEYSRCLSAHAKIYFEWRDYAESLRYNDEALPIQRRYLGRHHDLTLDTLLKRGHALVELDRIPEGLVDLREAVAIHKATLPANDMYTAAALLSLGESAAKADLHKEAYAAMQEALAITRRNPREGKFLARTLVELGMLQTEMGDFLAARTSLEEGLAQSEKSYGLDSYEMIYPLGALGELYGILDDPRRALTIYERQLAIKKKHLAPDDPELATTLHNLGMVYGDLEDYAQEKIYTEQSYEIYLKKYGPNSPQVARTYATLGSNAKSQGDATAARQYLERALSIYDKAYGPDNYKTAALYHNLGLFAREQGDYAEAERLYGKSLAIKKKNLSDSHPDVNVTTLQIATTRTLIALRDKSDPAPAIEEWDKARRQTARHMHAALPGLSDAEQLRYLSRFHGDLNVSLSIGLLWQDQQAIVRRSAEWLLNGKSVIQQALADQAIALRERNEQTTSAEYTAWQAARTKLAKAALGAGENLAELERQEQELARKFAAAAGRANTGGEWVTLEAVQANLPPRSRLIEIRGLIRYHFDPVKHDFTYDKPTYHAWIIPPANEGQVTIVEMGTAEDIEGEILATRKIIADVDLVRREGEAAAAAKTQQALQKLSERLWKPLAKSLADVDRLIISPDNELWLAPWAALPYDEQRQLLERYAISFAVSGRDLATKQTRSKSATAPLLFADPDFDLSAEGLKQATRAVLKDAQFAARSTGPLTRSSNLPRAERLPFTGEEAKAAAQTLQTSGTTPVSYTNQYALESVAKRMSQPRILLFSTHGYFLADPEQATEEKKTGKPAADQSDARNPTAENPLLRCGLLLAGCNQPQAPDTDDGVLTGLEIAGLDLRGTELVVLSACETGIGRVRNAEGVAGLRQAFQLAGAQSVVSTLWQVPDRDSALIMQDFFTNLAAGQTKADALRNAQLKRIATRKEKSGAAHPFFWAAWTVTGE